MTAAKAKAGGDSDQNLNEPVKGNGNSGGKMAPWLGGPTVFSRGPECGSQYPSHAAHNHLFLQLQEPDTLFFVRTILTCHIDIYTRK